MLTAWWASGFLNPIMHICRRSITLLQRKPELLRKGLVSLFRVMNAVKGHVYVPIGGIYKTNTQFFSHCAVSNIKAHTILQKSIIRDP